MEGEATPDYLNKSEVPYEGLLVMPWRATQTRGCLQRQITETPVQGQIHAFLFVRHKYQS